MGADIAIIGINWRTVFKRIEPPNFSSLSTFIYPHPSGVDKSRKQKTTRDLGRGVLDALEISESERNDRVSDKEIEEPRNRHS